MSGVKIIATKINENTYNQLKAIAESRNMKVYGLLQFICDAYIKCLGGKVNISSDIERIMRQFVPLEKIQNGFSLSSYSAKGVDCRKCVAIIEKKNKDYPEAVLLQAKGENVTECRNTDIILKLLLSCIAPNITPQIQTIQKENGLISLLDALALSVEEKAQEYSANSIEDEIMELFADNQRMVDGKQYDYAEFGKFKRSAHKSIK